jgi:hypothetical protein
MLQWFQGHVESDGEHEFHKPQTMAQQANFMGEQISDIWWGQRSLGNWCQGVILGFMTSLWTQWYNFVVSKNKV